VDGPSGRGEEFALDITSRTQDGQLGFKAWAEVCGVEASRPASISNCTGLTPHGPSVQSRMHLEPWREVGGEDLGGNHR
jgi:hypothetical protein